MEVSGQLHAPAALPPGTEPPILIGYEARWARGSVRTLWRREKSPALAGNRTPTFQPVARRYTDRAIPSPSRRFVQFKKLLHHGGLMKHDCLEVSLNTVQYSSSRIVIQVPHPAVLHCVSFTRDWMPSPISRHGWVFKLHSGDSNLRCVTRIVQ
jgi:hypothetical protein